MTTTTQDPLKGTISLVGSLRPVRAQIEIRFEEVARKVTPNDLERAVEAGVAAIRASLESRTPPYKIASIKGTVEYLYLQMQRKITG